MLFLPLHLWSSDATATLTTDCRTDPTLSSNSLADDGRDMRGAAADFASRFVPHVFAGESVRTSELAPDTDRKAVRDPHILLATTGQLPSTARLAMELHDAGARVSLIAPSNHPARALNFLAHCTTYRALAPRHCLETALDRLRPDIVIPCDERTVRDLHAIWRTTSRPHVKDLIRTSTAPARNFPIITSRAALLSLAQKEGVRVPPSMPLPDKQTLDRWSETHAAPFVLKADGS
jgi:hypothetical protein